VSLRGGAAGGLSAIVPLVATILVDSLASDIVLLAFIAASATCESCAISGMGALVRRATSLLLELAYQ
jgi:hypothetical protein